MKNRLSYHLQVVWISILFFILFSFHTKGNDMQDLLIKLPKTTTTRYQLLEKITQETGLLFVYDSSIFDDEKIISFPKGKYTLQKAIHTITGIDSLNFEIIGNHIVFHRKELIQTKDIISSSSPTPSSPGWVTIEGLVIDSYTQEPIPFVSIHITESLSGTITNLEGNFRIQVPDTLRHSFLHFSHVGYESLQLEPDLLKNKKQTLALIPKVIPLQEVVVRIVNPLRAIEEMLKKRKDNYPGQPVYLTSFYREGIHKQKELISLTEGVFKIYKPPFHSSAQEQVKLLKMRNYKNIAEKDTVVTRLKSGIMGSFLLDIVKNLPEFLTIDDPDNPYLYTHTDITIIDGRLANVISFEQRPGLELPLDKGELYIDRENSALVMARYEIDPAYVEKATNMLVLKKSKKIKVKARKATYTVSYKAWDNIYYVNHMRGDLHFHIRKGKQLFNSRIHAWFEMVTCNIETQNVHRFNQREVLPKTSIFSETNYIYDPSFWENLNIIIPEEELSDALSKINAKIEEINE